MTSDRRTVQAQILASIEALTRSLHAAGFAGGLNPAQWAGLRFVGAEGAEARTVANFARHHRATTGTASQTIDALVRKGLVQRNDNPADRRSALLTVTEAGASLLSADPIRRLEPVLSGLADQDISVLNHQLVLLALALEPPTA
ncbi:MAG: MarR family transcriptional regulator [Alphaproteobacteria bacterium]|nr:MarR family transcriptional regulator [Alphaproteobacteria bacterium]